MADLNSGSDIICLQETKLAAKDEAAFLDDFKGEGVFSAVADPDSDGPRATTGVAILFPAHIIALGLDVQVNTRRADSDGRWVAVDVSFNDARYTIVSVYAPAVQSERIPFLRGLRAALVTAEVKTTRLCVLGDFNAVLDGTLDRENGLPIRHGTGMEDFQNFVKECGLVDVWRRSSPLAREYTGPRRGGLCSRIDYALFTDDLTTDLSVNMEERRSPNRHRVVRAILRNKAGTQWAAGPPPFKVQHWMLENEKFCKVVKLAAEEAMAVASHEASKVTQYEAVKAAITSAARCAARQATEESNQEILDSRHELSKICWARDVLGKPLMFEDEVSRLKAILERHREKRDAQVALVVAGIKRRGADKPAEGLKKPARFSGSNESGTREQRNG